MTVFIDRTEVDSDKAPVVLYDNLFASGTIAVSSDAVNAGNAVNTNTYDFWTPTALPATYEVTLSGIRGANYIGVAAHNLFTTGCTISFERFVSPDWVEMASYTPTSDSAFMVAFTNAGSTKFRFYITGSSSPSIGVLFAGQVVSFSTGIMPGYTPIVYGEEIELLKSQTLSGQFITNRVNRRGASSNFNLNILDRSFVEGAVFQGFRRHYNDGKPFFFASNPSELSFDCAYCWRQDGGEIRPTFQNNGIFYQTALSLEAYIG